MTINNGDAGSSVRANINAIATSVDDTTGLYQSIANQNPVTGGTTYALSNTLSCSTPVARAGKVSAVSFWAAAEGNVGFSVLRPPEGVTAAPGVVMSRPYNILLPAVVGLNVVDVADLATVELLAGDIIGLAGTGRLTYTNVSAGGPRYYVTTGATPTLPALAADQRWEFGFTVEYEYSAETPLGAEVAQIDALALGLETKAEAEDVALLTGSTVSVGAVTPTAGTSTIATSNSMLLSAPMPASGTIRQLRCQSANLNTNARLVVYRPPEGVTPAPGVVMTRIVNSVVSLAAGDNTIDAATLGDIAFEAGDLIGMSANGSLRTSVGVPARGPRYYSVSGATPTLGALTADDRWEFGFDIEYDFDRTSTLGTAVQQMLDNGAAWQDTDSYVLLWIVGQSNAAGRATDASAFTIATGRGYKYDPTAGALAHLVDPTGTDATAQLGRASIGPAIAQAVLEATGGRVGVIVVNSAVGGTAIADWASGGSAWLAATPQYDAAVADAVADQLNVIGAAAVMIQGESDGAAATAAATYKSGVIDLRDRMRVKTGVDAMPLIISQIGIDTDVPSSAGYAAIRVAQSEMARDGDVVMAHRGAKYFSSRGLMLDDLHYVAAGLDEIGGAIGAAVAALAIGAAPVEFDA